MSEVKPQPPKKMRYGKATVTVWFRYDDTKNPNPASWFAEIVDSIDEFDNVEEVTVRKLESFNVESGLYEKVDTK